MSLAQQAAIAAAPFVAQHLSPVLAIAAPSVFVPQLPPLAIAAAGFALHEPPAAALAPSAFALQQAPPALATLANAAEKPRTAKAETNFLIVCSFF
ncbi:MAG: hypothetical protein SF069_09210 [Phycisphaerae bacterium]|nr:hypothetical protein [Phycisphaerae bacterium]